MIRLSIKNHVLGSKIAATDCKCYNTYFLELKEQYLLTIHLLTTC